MSKYIDAEKELKELKNMKVEGEVFTTAVNFAIKVIEDAPSIDIVRCKECKYAHLTYDGDCKYCDIWFLDEPAYLSGNDFCSQGERREQ